MTTSINALADIRDPAFTQALHHKLDNKTKPLGSLGRLEALALQLGQILGTENPGLEQPQMVVFAADHGLAARGVSAFPSDVTWQMVENFLAGGAAVSVLARQHRLALTVVDCGVNRDFLAGLPAGATRPGLQVRKVAMGSADSSAQAAMTPEQCRQAIANGQELVKALPGNTLILGEMGIGNTSSAALILSLFTPVPVEDCAGRGTGLTDEQMKKKVYALTRAHRRHHHAVMRQLDVDQ